MKIFHTALLVAMLFTAVSAHAEDKAPTSSQGKTSTCNKDAGDRTGDERKAFMKACQKRENDEKKAQKEKNKACKHESASKSGEERKAFMKECMNK
jgi:hypothetical protein